MKRSESRKPYLNPRLPVAERVRDLLGRLTLREKVAQMVHRAPPVPRLGLPAYNWWNECLHGVARAGRATVFPQAIGMAAAFDAPLLRRVAAAIADEARAKHHEAVRLGNRGQYFGLTYWTPNINIFRDPRWGRGQETYGEDPYLTGRLAVAFIRGLQGDDPRYLKVVATAKHFAVHSGPEPLRHRFNAVVSPRDLRETYLPAFKAAVTEGRVQSVMGAYNRTNGEPCCGSPTLLRKILREEWGFDGYVVSDCWAIQDFHQGHQVTKTPQESAALAVRHGCDLNCGHLFQELVAAVQQGLIREEEIDTALARLLTARFRLGLFDPERRVPYAALRPETVNSAAHRALALRMARESLVLLKNNGILPLSRRLRHLLVTGPNALDTLVLLGNYNGFAPRMDTIFAAILGKLSAGAQAVWTPGCDLSGTRPLDRHLNGLLKASDPPLDAVVAVVGYTAQLEGEEGAVEGGDGDRHHYGLPGRQQELLETLKASGRPLIVVVTGGSPIDLSWAQAQADAVLFVGYPGEAGGPAVADVLFGDYNPAGRLPITFPKSYAQLPPFEDYAMAGRTYRFMTEEPLYRFGYGLSYTTFAYSGLQLSRRAIGRTESVRVRVQVRNRGRRAGDEVVQLYVRDEQASVPVPRWHLEGFARVALRPGQRKTVRFTIRPEQLAAYDDAGRPFVEPGTFRISVGGGQPDDPHAGAVSTLLTVR